VSDRLRTVLGTAGIALTLLGVLAVTNPDLVGGTEPLATLVTTLSDAGLSRLLLGACVMVGLVLVRLAWRSSGGATAGGADGRSSGNEAGNATDPGTAFDRLLDAPPEAVTVETATPTAAALDARVDRAVAGDEAALASVRDRLASVATDRLVRYRGDAPAAAQEAVAAGTWTDDRVAAAFLSGSRGPIYSFGSRLRLWLDPETERRRRLDRTVGAVDAIDGRTAPPGPPSPSAQAASQVASPPRGAPPRTGSAPRQPDAQGSQTASQPRESSPRSRPPRTERGSTPRTAQDGGTPSRGRDTRTDGSPPDDRQRGERR